MDSNKFSWAEAVANQDGKTSGSGVLGLIVGLVGALCFLIATIVTLIKDKDTAIGTTVITQSASIILIAAGLLGVRKAMGNKTEAGNGGQ
jgi:hypothetical protein